MAGGTGGKLKDSAERLVNGIDKHPDPERLVEETRTRFPSRTIDTGRYYQHYVIRGKDSPTGGGTPGTGGNRTSSRSWNPRG
jgi:hypothetical protein